MPGILIQVLVSGPGLRNDDGDRPHKIHSKVLSTVYPFHGTFGGGPFDFFRSKIGSDSV